MTTRKHIRKVHTPRPLTAAEIARITRSDILLVISVLVFVEAGLILKVVYGLWPGWLIEYRSALIAVILYAIIFIALFSPVMIEANSKPREQSGPGKIPELNYSDLFKNKK